MAVIDIARGLHFWYISPASLTASVGGPLKARHTAGLNGLDNASNTHTRRNGSEGCP